MHALTLVSFAVVVGQGESRVVLMYNADVSEYIFVVSLAIALSPRVPIEALLAKRADVAGVSDSDIPSQVR